MHTSDTPAATAAATDLLLTTLTGAARALNAAGAIDRALDALADALAMPVDELDDKIARAIELRTAPSLARIAKKALAELRERGCDLPPPGSFEDEIDEAVLVLAHTRRSTPRAAAHAEA